MKIKNPKFFKSAAIVAGGVVLTETFLYGLVTVSTGKLPFANNKDQAYKVYIDEYTKNGKNQIEEYVFETKKFAYPLTIYTPYYVAKDKKIQRDKYAVKINLLESELETLIHNISNQENILNQDFIRNKLEYVVGNNRYNNEWKLLSCEVSDTIPNDNSYEVEYTDYRVDKNDTKIMDVPYDIMLDTNILFFTSSGFILAPYFSVCNSYFNLNRKQKTKNRNCK